MKLHILFLALVAFMLISVASAEVQTLGTFKQNECVILTQICSDCTYVNITSLINPNSTIVLTNKIMTKNGYSYNYTFCDTSLLGDYIYNTIGNPSGILTTQPINFVITPTGYDFTTGDSIIIILAFLAIGILALIFFVFGMNNDNVPVKIFCLAMSVMFIIFLFGFSYNIFTQLLGKYQSSGTSMSVIYIVLIALGTVGGIGVVVWLIAYILNLWWKHRGFTD